MCNAIMMDELWNCSVYASILHWKSKDNPENAFLTALTVSSTLLSFVEEYEKGHLVELTFDEVYSQFYGRVCFKRK